MADQQKNIKFSAVDNGISSFMKRLQNDSRTLYSDFAKEAQKQTTSQKEQLKLIEAQIRALKLQNDLEKEQNRIILERRREAGVITDKKYQSEISQMKDDEKVNSLQIKLLQQLLQDQKDKTPEDPKPEKKEVITNSILAAGLIRDIFGMIRQFPNASTGLDFVSPAAGIAGSGAGALAGTALEAATVGQIEYATIGANIGKEVGGFLGDAITRSFRLRDEFDRAASSYSALTGSRANVSSMTGMGYDDTAVANSLMNIASARGGRAGMRDARLSLGLQRGFSIQEGVLNESFGLERSGGGSTSMRLQRVLGISIAEGLDRAKFTDAIKNQSQLMTQFAQSSTNVNANDVNRTLFEFNRMGGMFSIGDPRAMGNISAIQEGLTNPNSPFAQAQNYSVLRRLNPNAGMWQLRKMQEQGLQTPQFLQSVLSDITSMGGSEDFQKFQMKGRFQNLSFEAIDTLFANRDRLGSMTQSELNKILGQKSITSEAEQNTSKLMRYSAEVSNAFRDNFLEGIKVVKDQFVSEMSAATTEIARVLKEQFNSISGSEGYVDSNFKVPDSETIYKTPGAKTPNKQGYKTIEKSDRWILIKDIPRVERPMPVR